ncbi:MAG: class I SAM-dependent methyltransferase [Bacteroidota bacterium]
MKHEDNPKSIKYHVKRYLYQNQAWYKGQKVIDFPAGNGVTSRILKEIGAVPIAYDLFPEYFELDDLTCQRVNIRDGLPAAAGSVDALICQEGIEHFSDQFQALQEFNRVLKPKGTLLITTPNYSNLRAKMSYLLGESERFNAKMAPNELDSVWMSRQDLTAEFYFGHIFLIGIQKLRVLAKLAGFRLHKIHFTRLKPTSVLLFPFCYPFIWLSNWITYRKSLRRHPEWSMADKKEVYQEVFSLAVNPQLLVDGHLMVEFIKEKPYDQVGRDLRSIHQEFGLT